MTRPTARIGGLVGVLATLLFVAALSTLPELPEPGAEPLDVFSYLFDNRNRVLAGAALLLGGSLLIVPVLGSLRFVAYGGRRSVAGASMLGFGLLGIGGLALYGAILITLADEAERADPATLAAVLDLGRTVLGAAGLSLGLALASAVVVVRRSRGRIPGRLAVPAAAAALGTALWAGRFFSDGGVLGPDGLLGSTLGSLLLLIWLAATSLWLATDRGDRSRVPISVPAGRRRVSGDEDRLPES